MVKNRLEELKANSKHVSKTAGNGTRSGSDDVNVEMEPLSPAKKNPLKGSQASPACSEFFDRFGKVIAEVDEVARDSAEVRRIHCQILNSAHRRDPAEEARLADLVESIRARGARIRNSLKHEQDVLDEAVRAKLQASSAAAKATAAGKTSRSGAREDHELRLMRTQVSAQSRRFLDIWADYNGQQLDFRDKSKALLVRRCKIVNSSLTEEQLEDMLDEGNTQVFAANILDQEKAARQQLTELQDRHDEFLKLERSIREVHGLFLELAALVEQQGELVDNIQAHVEDAAGKVGKGRKELQEAERTQRRNRKLKLILAVVVAVVALIVVLVMLAEFGAFSGGGGDGDGSVVVHREQVVVEKVVVVPGSSTTTTTTTLSPDQLEDRPKQNSSSGD